VFAVNAANLNLKVGILNNFDIQVVIENYIYEQVRAPGVTERKSGFGDLTTRLKVICGATTAGKQRLQSCHNAHAPAVWQLDCKR
jgi:hypothetical protein